ncbi:hypothetical protein QYE76_047296 [Lolium multiflorum]|uniref:Uncharacterized protein n=1 Tax=Lolium multiflorum TaxID=4521 RepID=A0AAD8X1T9_LOLMU|nr:hypothetical protein QYE76_047296 [Lolium multiflorum]
MQMRPPMILGAVHRGLVCNRGNAVTISKLIVATHTPARVGLRSSTHAVLTTLSKSVNELFYHQRKVFRGSDHADAALAGLTADS